MGFKEKLSLFLENWIDCLPILFSTILLYFFLFLIGTIFTFPFHEPLNKKKDLAALFYKLFIGIIVFLFIVSIVFTKFRTINIALVIPFLIIYKYYKEHIIFKFKGVMSHFKNGLKSFLFSLLILLFILFFQLWMFDFFNPQRLLLWVDFTFYTSIFQKMGIENCESSIYGIPNNFENAPYGLYHYSDLWITKGFSSLIPLQSNTNIYTYIYTSISATIFIIGSISLLKIKTKFSSIVIPFVYIFLISFLTIGLFVYHPPKTYIPEACILLMLPYLMNNRINVVIAMLMISVILNPIYLIFIPACVLIFINQYYTNNLKFKEFVLKSKYFLYCLLLSIIALSIITYINYFEDRTDYWLILKKNFRADVLNKYKDFQLFQLFKILFVVLLFYFQIIIKKRSFLVLFLFFLTYLFSVFIKVFAIDNNNELWQLGMISGQVLNFLIVIFSINLFFEKNIFNSFKYWAFIALMFYVAFQNYKTLYYGSIRLIEYEGFPSFSKPLISSISNKINSENCIVGFYTQFKDEEPIIEEYHQGLRVNSFMVFAESFQNKKLWTVPVFIHNRLDSLSENLQNSWRHTDYYRFSNQLQYNSQSQVFTKFVSEKNVEYLITDIDFRKLPDYIKKSISFLAIYKPTEKKFTNYNLTFYKINKY